MPFSVWPASLTKTNGFLAGGTSSTSYPGASMASQLGGLGLTGLGTYGLLNSTGALSGLSGLFGGGGAGMADAFGAAAAGGSTGFDLGSILFGLAGAAEGGRVGLQGGGLAPQGGGGLTPSPNLPNVPSLNLDYLVPPGPAVKGAGVPHPPPVPQGAMDAASFDPSKFLAQERMVAGALNSAPPSGSGMGFGGRPAFQDGGGLGAAETTSTPLAGMPPTI